MKLEFLELDDVLAIHAESIRRFGGGTGLRDSGLLESALAMPRATMFGELLHQTIHEQAAAYLFHLVKNHPFVDGNKRVAFFATDVFLRLNGWKLRVDANKAHRFLIALLEAGTCDFDHLLPWIRRSLAPLRKRS